MPVRVAFLGNDPWSVPSLEALAGEPETGVVLVLTNPPRPAGRGSALRPTTVAEVARIMSLPVQEVDRAGEGAGLKALHVADPEVLVVVAFGEVLRRELLVLAPLGAINLHFSLLPRWRGAAPVRHAILAGDRLTGVTVMRMNEGLDTGPILGTLEEAIRPDDDAGTLGERLARLGSRLLVGVVRQLAEGGLPARVQDEARATLAPRLGPEQRVLDWRGPAEDVVRRIRALAPSPGATTHLRGTPVKVVSAAAGRLDRADLGPPGTIESVDDRGIAVATGRGIVHLLEVAPAGRRRMSASSWAHGARFEPGERLG